MNRANGTTKYFLPPLILGLGVLLIFGLLLIVNPAYYPYYLIAYASLIGFAALLYFYPSWIKKEGTPKSFKWQKLTNLSIWLSGKDNRIRLIEMLISLFLFGVFFARFYFAYDALYYDTVALQDGGTLSLNRVETVLGSLSTMWWTGTLMFLVIGCFRKSRVTEVITRYVATPLVILLFLSSPFALTGIVGKNSGLDYRGFLMGVELGLMGALAFIAWYKKPSFDFKKSDVKIVIASVFFLLAASINSYTIPTLLGTDGKGYIIPDDLNLTHRLLIYAAFLLPIAYYLLLKPFPILDRRALLYFAAQMSFFGFASMTRFDTWLHLQDWPLHLCVTAMYTMPFVLAFNTVGVFYFTMFINVLGAFFALLMPNYSTSGIGAFTMSIGQFYINHLYAFFMPVLIILLGIYKRPKIRYFIYSQIGFLIYFVFVAWANIHLTLRGIEADFFFINSDFIADKLGAGAEAIFRQTIPLTRTINGESVTIDIHLLYMIIYYFVYVLLALGMWFLYELLFRVVDELDHLYELKLVAKQNQGVRAIAFAKGGKHMLNKGNEEKETNVNVSLEINHLQKRYGNNTKNTVEDFSLYLEGGKIYGFLGKNGAGKSTIIKSIVGVHSFNGGEIKVCGYDVANEPAEAKTQIGFVPDNYALYENLTGRQYVNYIADLYRVSKEKRNQIIPDLVNRLELNLRFDEPMKSYSHGMKQKVTIIAALVHEPKLWILDEPMTGLDPNSIFQIKELMREHASKGNIVFFSSHIIDVVKNLCDEVIILKHGELIDRFNVHDLNEKGEDLESLFLTLTADKEESK